MPARVALLGIGLFACAASAPDTVRPGPARASAQAPPPRTTSTPTSEAAPTPPAPSALTELGLRELVSIEGTGAGARAAAERAIAEASPALARCFRASLDRDPTLKGNVSFTMSLGPHGHAAGL